MVLALSITSQYSLKSVNIRQKYFRIMDCSESGLKKPSWVDTINILRFSPSTFSHFRVIGKLTQRDKICEILCGS
ncbi:relB superfamily domain protein [Streptococcus mutans]|nr:relB superfamily domain protein [Streptococcus mutans]